MNRDVRTDPAQARGVPRLAIFLLYFLPVLGVAVALTVKGHPGYGAVLLGGELSMSGLIALATRRPAATTTLISPPPLPSGEQPLPRLVARPATATRPWVVAVALVATFAAIVAIAVLGSRAG